MKEMVNAEVLKLRDVGIIYSITNSKWVNPIQVVPRKCWVTDVQNEDGVMVFIRIAISWHMYIDYLKLSQVTRKDYFPLPFLNNILESCGI